MGPSTPIPQRSRRRGKSQRSVRAFHRRADRSHRQGRRQRARAGRIPCLCHLGLRRRDHARRRAYRRRLLGGSGGDRRHRRGAALLRPAQLPRRLLRPADGRRHRCRPGDAAARDAGLLGARAGDPASARRRRLAPATGQRSGLVRDLRGHRLRAGSGGVHRYAGARADAHQRQRRAGRVWRGEAQRRRERHLPAFADLARLRLSARPGSGSCQLDGAIGPGYQDQPCGLPAERRVPEAAARGQERRGLDVQRQGSRSALARQTGPAGTGVGGGLRGGRGETSARRGSGGVRGARSGAEAVPELPHLRAVQTGAGAGRQRRPGRSARPAGRHVSRQAQYQPRQSRSMPRRRLPGAAGSSSRCSGCRTRSSTLPISTTS